MPQRVTHQLVNDESAGNRRVDAQIHVGAGNPQGDSVSVDAEGLEQLRRKFAKILREANAGQVGCLIEFLVNERHGSHSTLTRFEQLPGFGVQQIVGGTLLEGSGDHDKRHVGASFLQQAKRPQRIELRQRVVGKDHIRRPIKLSDKVLWRVDALRIEVDANLSQRVQCELCVGPD